MATVRVQLPPMAWIPAASNGAQFVVVGGSSFPVPSLAFDGGSTDETAYAVFRADSYGSGNLTIDIDWYTNSAQTSGNVVWGVQIACITPDTDSQDVETDSLATANTQQDSHLGTTAQRVHRCTLTLSNLDSIAAGDLVYIALYRDASDTTNDTLAADANVLMVEVSYSDA